MQELERSSGLEQHAKVTRILYQFEEHETGPGYGHVRSTVTAARERYSTMKTEKLHSSLRTRNVNKVEYYAAVEQLVASAIVEY